MDREFFNKNVVNGKDFEAQLLDTTTKVRCRKIDDNTVFVFAKGKRRYGNYVRLNEFLLKAQPIVKTKKELEIEWHSRCKRCEKRLEKSGLWPALRVIFHNLQLISYDDWTAMKNLELRSATAVQYIKKYPFVSQDGQSIDYDYVNEVSYANCKSMFFGKGQNDYYKGQIKQALQDKTAYSTGRISLNYDVSFQYKPETQQAWYSEEYRNCGNGHYYLALDESAALFYEDD